MIKSPFYTLLLIKYLMNLPITLSKFYKQTLLYLHFSSCFFVANNSINMRFRMSDKEAQANQAWQESNADPTQQPPPYYAYPQPGI